MTDETQIILAFLFKRSGKTRVKESELYLPLSLELGWFTASQANQFVQHAFQQGFLKKEEGFVHPTFDINTIDIPTGFKPTRTSFQIQTKEEPREITSHSTTLEKILQHIQKQKNIAKEQLEKELEQIATEKGVLPEVAALILTKKYDIDSSNLYDEVEQLLFKENTE